MVHSAGLRRWEQVRVVWVLAVFFEQESDCCLWDGDFPDGILRFRSANLQLPFPIPARLLAHGDGAALDVEVMVCCLPLQDTQYRKRMGIARATAKSYQKFHSSKWLFFVFCGADFNIRDCMV